MEGDPIWLAAQLEPVGVTRLEPWDEAASTLYCQRQNLGRRVPPSEAKSASLLRAPISFIRSPPSRLVERSSAPHCMDM